MKPGSWIMIAAILGFLAVALGAFGAHALQDRFGDYEKGIWQTAVQYHLAHALVLFSYGVALTAVPDYESAVGSGPATAIGICFTAGIVIFSGSLYALALSGVKILGAVTPLGGLAFLAGWAMLARFGYLISNR